MTVDYIIPCVCCDHPPSVDDSSTYGMPIITPHNSVVAHKQFWEARCPKCGRGGAFHFPSPYLAMKDWNTLQRHLYEYEKKEIILEESWKNTCNRLGWKYDERLEHELKYPVP